MPDKGIDHVPVLYEKAGVAVVAARIVNVPKMIINRGSIFFISFTLRDQMSNI